MDFMHGVPPEFVFTDYAPLFTPDDFQVVLVCS
jgi:hypothetical protein